VIVRGFRPETGCFALTIMDAGSAMPGGLSGVAVGGHGRGPLPGVAGRGSLAGVAALVS
jgi:hypothetical protein